MDLAVSFNSVRRNNETYKVPPIEPHAVYVLVQDSRGLPAGTRVISASFPDGALRSLVGSKRAVLVGDLEERNKISVVVKSEKGANYSKCGCPVWCDGDLNGKRYRRSLGARDWGRAGRRLAKLEEPGARQPKPISEAIEAFHVGIADRALATRTKYKRVLRFVGDVLALRGLKNMDEVGVEDIDAYRASRTISAVTWLKELEIMRQFFQFAAARKWIEDNPAAMVDKPKNLKPNEVVPYNREEVIKILAACDQMGRYAYERLRARATVLLCATRAFVSRTWPCWHGIGCGMGKSTSAP
jgi:hypothetical protein